ncbi:MAG: sensor histidine kinase [Saccharofermentanales bacterium]
MLKSIFQSIFLRRILVLLSTTVILFSILTSSLYFVISRGIYTNMKARELEPKANNIGSFVIMYQNGLIPMQYLTQLLSAGPASWDAWVFVLGMDGQILVQSEVPAEVDPSDGFIKEISSKTDIVLNGDKVKNTIYLQNNKDGMMIIGVPVIDEGIVIGAVFLAKPIVEINAGVNSMINALFLSTIICLILMIFPIIYAGNRLMKPLRQTRDVAIAMANGNFSVRAVVKAKGEISDLAESFNLLGERLEKTISDLVLEKNRLIRVVNGLAEGIIAVDIHCNVTHANPALWKLLHIHDNEKSYGDQPQNNESAIMLRPSDPQFIRHQLISDESVWNDFRNVIMTSEPITRELVHNETIICVMITPIEDEAGKTIGAVGLFKDITEAEILEQTRKDYVANVSHELRTPLTAMRGLIEPLADGLVKTEKDKKRYYDIILRETMRLSRLIEDMLELSRLQSGKITIDMKPFYIQDIVEDVVDKYRITASDKGIAIDFSENFKNLPLVKGNPDRIEQVLIIFIDNALKFTQATGKIYLDAIYNNTKNPNKIYVTVKDTGIGIEPDKAAKVFDRFFKADQARYGTEGTGLGLSIAKEILNAMGEEVSVTSTPGKGSTFMFSLSVMKS